jgi:hypothetical protein
MSRKLCGCTYVPFGRDVTTAAEARLVATREEDHPVVGLASSGLCAWRKSLLPVVVVERMDHVLGNLGGAGISRRLRRRNSAGDIFRSLRGSLVEPPHELVGKRNLLLGQGHGREG